MSSRAKKKSFSASEIKPGVENKYSTITNAETRDFF